jgi:dihydropyrimidinase/allantoinase
VGSDADLCVVDPDLEQVVTPELCRSAQDHTPFAGKRVKGWPVATVLRGTVMFDGADIADGWPGRYLHRVPGGSDAATPMQRTGA